MSQLPSHTPIESSDVSAGLRNVRLTVQRMLVVLESPDTTADESRRACSTIRDALELHEQPAASSEECEGSAAANAASVYDCNNAMLGDRRIGILEPQMQTLAARCKRAGEGTARFELR